MTANGGVSAWRVAYGLAYGGIVAGAYLFARVRGQHGGLDLLAWAGLVIFAAHVIVFPRLALRGVFRPKLVLRGVLYGLTQVLIFTAMSSGNTATALVASTTGSIFGVVLGRLILGERVRGLALAAVFVSTAAVFQDPGLILGAGWGLLGGLIQGLGFVIVRSLMIDRESVRSSISAEFFWAALVSAGALVWVGDAGTLFRVDWQDVAAAVFLAGVIQYAFFHLFKVLDSQRASMLTLSRIPWALAFEGVLLGIVPGTQQITTSGLVLMAAALLVMETRMQGLWFRTRKANGGKV